MSSIDKVKIGDTTYDVSPSASGTLNGYTSNDNGTPPSAWSEVSTISSGDTNSSIFGKLTSMMRNVRWLYAKLGTEDFSGTGQSTITGALSSLQSGLDDKSPSSHTHTTATLPVSSNQVNSENYVPTSALLYSMVQRANSIMENVQLANEIINGGGTSGPSDPSDPSTTWLYEESGTFEVPITGTYQVEIHGGGGGGGGGYVYMEGFAFQGAGGGGGSGEIYTTELIKGDIITVTVGAGGAGGQGGTSPFAGSKGESSTFGDLSCDGGGGGQSGKSHTGGTASGSLATAGGYGAQDSGGSGSPGASGGEGNKNNTDQTYGDGGTGGTRSSGENGKPGAVIITFMGVS